ncbi:MAG TPA: metallophosphoesterase [Candidatus Acidoferrales bacterium]|nr:metallophosphoesterase [Candidatus Acidoferrales bacterium]
MFSRILCLTAAAAALLGAASKVVGGPVAVNVTPRTATIVWVVQTDELTLHLPDGARQSPSLHVEKTNLTGLQPNTRYQYDVGDLKGSFKTAPVANAAQPFRFVVFGDTRTRHDVHRHVIEAMVAHGIPDFVIHTGDLVADGNDSSMWPVFFDIERELLRQTAFFPSLGNHERNSRDYYEFFHVETPFYSFNWGNAHFSVLNTDYGNAASSPAARDAFWTEQTRWLEEDLAANQKTDFRFVVGHHPPISAVARRQEFNPHMVALVPLFEKYHVNATFFGHDHNYQHYLKNGIHYVITGGGGAPLYDVDKPDPAYAVKVVSTENFVTVNVEGKAAKVKSTALDGKILDEFEIK